MKFFYDTEFIENGKTVDLISIGIVREDGSEYYSVASDAPWDRVRRHPWLMRNVVPHLPGSKIGKPIGYSNPRVQIPPGREWLWSVDTSSVLVKPRWVIANEVLAFLLGPEPTEHTEVELWGWYSDYDHVALAQLWGPMVDMPPGLPHRTNDLQQEADRLGNPPLPEHIEEHNALADARYNVAIARALGVLKGADDES